MLLARRPARLLGGAGARCMSSWGSLHLPKIKNEPVLQYAPGSPERAELKRTLDVMRGKTFEVPCVVGGERIFSGDVRMQPQPANHKQAIASIHMANEEIVLKARDAALEARKFWANMPAEDRMGVFMKAADIASSELRQVLNAATMLGQSKSVMQAEIDSAVELCDFWRFNVKYASELYGVQPPESAFAQWNRVEYRALEGFILAISPFNFTAIGGNLPTVPAIVGNVTLWKPAFTACYSNYLVYEILEKAGLPPGVINFVPGSPPAFEKVLADPNLGGLHFTGSTATFRTLNRVISDNLSTYKSYPRVVGETGGKNYHWVHPSANYENVINCTVRGAFEYQGQKCSATSRLYVPESWWPQVGDDLASEVSKIKMGQPTDFDSFMCAVIDENSFDKISGYIQAAKDSPSCTIVAGGNCDKSTGFFVQPTIIHTTDPHFLTMEEEIFGPVLTVYVYPDSEWRESLDLVNETSPYGLTGAIFALDRRIIKEASDALRDVSGNFYVNDKCTGSVVGQQPFGGARQSGTNDKAGFGQNVLRWVSSRSIKESNATLKDWRYPHMQEE